MLYSHQPDPQLDFELVCIEHMVPQDHLLRHISKYMDFTFITEKVRPYYSETHGRPSIDPIMLFKMLFIGYLYGIRSERQFEQEINYSPNPRY
jgi:transposase